MDSRNGRMKGDINLKRIFGKYTLLFKYVVRKSVLSNSSQKLSGTLI